MSSVAYVVEVQEAAGHLSGSVKAVNAAWFHCKGITFCYLQS
jgi:hypothetical protein